MQYVKRVSDYQKEHNSIITLGKFDGFHRGHQKLIQTVLHYSKEMLPQEKRLLRIVFAFNMLEFRKKYNLPYEQIMLPEEKIGLVGNELDYLIECPFDDEIRCMSAETFISDILIQKLHAKVVVVGSDYRFGYQAKGDVNMLRKYAKQYGYEVVEIEKEMYGEREISSTYIKEQLKCGNIEMANEMLGYSYSITGPVIHGRKLGRTIGFPTMNLPISDEKFLPPYGVYIAKVQILDSEYFGVVNLGRKPTVSKGERPLVEAYVFDYEGDAYGEVITVSFVKLLRREVKFESIEALKLQIAKDFAETEAWIENKTLQ